MEFEIECPRTYPWTVEETMLVFSVLKNMSREIRERNINSQLETLCRENKPENEEEIAFLRNEIASLDTKTLNDLALPLDQEYDWDEAARRINITRSANEIKTLWKRFLHPAINKEAWTNKEHYDLKRIAIAFELQNWNEIAKRLNTGRSGYQCYLYYCENIVTNNLPQKVVVMPSNQIKWNIFF